MRTSLILFVILWGSCFFAFGGDDDFFQNFYDSMNKSCLMMLDASSRSINYCKCSTETFKKDFSQSDKDKLLKFVASISQMPPDHQMRSIVKYMSSKEINDKAIKAARECSHFLIVK